MASNITRLRELVKRQDRALRGPSTGPFLAVTNPSIASTPISPSPEPVMTFLDMPRNNVFLKHRKPTIKGFKEQWTDQEYQKAATIAAQQDAINEDMDYSETLELTTAATTHFGSQHYSHRLFYDFQRMMEIMVFRYGSVPAERVTELMGMMPKGIVNGSNSQGIRKKLLAQQTQAKANTQSFLVLSMEQLLVEVPDFRNATKEARVSLLTRMFDQSKIAISENLFYVEAQSVNIANIFRSDDDVRRRWQTLLRTRFVNLAMKAYNTLILDEKDSKGSRDKLGHYIDSHMSSPTIVGLGLGSYKDVPTTAHRSIANKRHMAKFVVEDED